MGCGMAVGAQRWCGWQWGRGCLPFVLLCLVEVRALRRSCHLEAFQWQVEPTYICSGERQRHPSLCPLSSLALCLVQLGLQSTHAYHLGSGSVTCVEIWLLDQ